MTNDRPTCGRDHAGPCAWIRQGDGPRICLTRERATAQTSPQAAQTIERQRHHITELEAALDRVRRLHSQPADYLAPGRWCPSCGEEEPCPTIRALRAPR